MLDEVGDEPTREEVELLHLYGFHEVSRLVDAWQRGRTGVDVPVGLNIFPQFTGYLEVSRPGLEPGT